jgi:hypothetical protein
MLTSPPMWKLIFRRHERDEDPLGRSPSPPTSLPFNGGHCLAEGGQTQKIIGHSAARLFIRQSRNPGIAIEYPHNPHAAIRWSRHCFPHPPALPDQVRLLMDGVAGREFPEFS